ncbi:MAG TPA: YeeE/YedE thiosulfate transporter family protein [Gemmatimonadaceae bacterium]|nr:YeeE/YedE thiosulfate transporter family protein [Gemmatimonadaceae bacterium]
MSSNDRGAPYMSPYLAGVGIGVVLLVTYVVMGHGLGVSGALTSVVGTAATSLSNAPVLPAWEGYAASSSRGLLGDWFVVEVIGIVLGGLLSAALAGRLRPDTERGERVTVNRRLVFAVGGGAIMGIGARLAKGCTSGQAITGGSLLSVGSWIFIVAAFAAAYLVAPLVRREWR